MSEIKATDLDAYWTKPCFNINVPTGTIIIRENLLLKKFKTKDYQITFSIGGVDIPPEALLDHSSDQVDEEIKISTRSLTDAARYQMIDMINSLDVDGDYKNDWIEKINNHDDLEIKLPSEKKIIQRKLAAAGFPIKIRWPYQRILRLTVNDISVDTMEYDVVDEEDYPFQADVDYTFRIVNPVAFATMFNPIYSNYGASGCSWKKIVDAISMELKAIFVEYLKTIKYSAYQKKEKELLNSILEKRKLEFSTLESKYGILFSKLMLSRIYNKVESENKMKEKQAEKDREIALKDSKNKLQISENEAEAIKKKGAAKNELLQQSVDIMNQSSDPNSVALLNNNGTNIIIGGNSNNNNPAVAGVVASQVTQAQQQTQQTSSNNNNGGITVDALRNALISNGKTEDEINQILATLGLGNNNQNSNENSNQGPSMHQ